MGIDKYNEECRSIVMRYSSEWRKTVERMGRWIDFDNDYKTLNTPFMESVWWAFSELFKKGLVYRGLKVMPYSTGCLTPLSNFEAGQNYKDVNDPAGMLFILPVILSISFFVVTVAFPLVDDRTTSLLAWTTTPWTLPSNLALCVHPDYTYVKIHDDERDQNFILHENLLRTLYKDPKKAKFKKIGTFKGADMKGWRYVPLFEYFTEQVCCDELCTLIALANALDSLKTRLSASLLIRMSRMRTVRELFTKHLHLVKTITALPLPTAFCWLRRCPHVPLTIQGDSQSKSQNFRDFMSRYVLSHLVYAHLTDPIALGCRQRDPESFEGQGPSHRSVHH